MSLENVVPLIPAMNGTFREPRFADARVPFEDEAEFEVDYRPADPRVRFLDLRRPLRRRTPVADFFVFHQTRTPRIDADTWRLQVGGCVRNPAEFTLADLMRVESLRHAEVVVECAGNQPTPQKLNGQVGNARWSGIRLRSVLDRCELLPSAREVVFFAADAGREPSGVIDGFHGRSVFVQDALDDSVILATHMNGELLIPDHGFPLRVILPGWYGMAQIKWLTRIEVLDRRYEGPHMSRNYHSMRAGSLPIETSISKTRLKSVITRITPDESCDVHRVEGAAWGGPAAIDRVELRINDGPWVATTLAECSDQYAWRLWSFAWRAPVPGRHHLVSCAIDVNGNLQPTFTELRAEIQSERENNSQWERVVRVPEPR